VRNSAKGEFLFTSEVDKRQTLVPHL
jgi:hypothetical protein